MVKVILNNETEYPLIANEVNYSATLQIDGYSEHVDTLNMNISISSAENLIHFENTPLESIEILNSQDEPFTTITFGNNIYIISYNTNIYDNNAAINVSINKVSIPQAETM